MPAPPLPSVATFFFSCCADHRDLHSFPTRRSSDLVSKKGLRQLLLAGITVVFAGGVLFSDYIEAEKKKVDDVIANGQAQKDKLTVLRNRAQEVQKTLVQWKGLRERIQASLPRRGEPASEREYEGEELQQFLAALQG